jgi:hypothetical protein
MEWCRERTGPHPDARRIGRKQGNKDKQASCRGHGFVEAPLAQQLSARPRVHSGVYLRRQLQEKVCGARSLRHPHATRSRTAHSASVHYALPSTRSLPWICVKTSHCHSSSQLLGLGRSRVEERRAGRCASERMVVQSFPIFQTFPIFKNELIKSGLTMLESRGKRWIRFQKAE